jgi:phosphoglycerate dehydrogenase-like enzyme
MQHHTTPSLAVAIAPADAASWIADAVRESGGRVVAPAQAEALIWGGWRPDGLQEVLEEGPRISWVQLPSAGVEAYAGLIDGRRIWTCAKGIYAQPVAEHALALALAGLHHLPRLARARTWRRTLCRDLSGGSVTVIGGGGIASTLLDLLAPFHVAVTVVRRHPQDLPGASRVLGADALHDALPRADVVILAPALTPETEGMIGAPELRLMKSDAWLVNVGRGKLVRTDDLVEALRQRWIGGAALDVTDPEPLPDDHPLWNLDNCLITPHCANPPPLADRRYAELIRENVGRRIEGRPLAGLVDACLGY